MSTCDRGAMMSHKKPNRLLDTLFLKSDLTGGKDEISVVPDCFEIGNFHDFSSVSALSGCCIIYGWLCGSPLCRAIKGSAIDCDRVFGALLPAEAAGLGQPICDGGFTPGVIEKTAL